MQAMDALSLKAAQNVDQVMKDAAKAVKKALQFCGTDEQKLEFLQVASENLIERSVPLAAETSVASGAIHKMYTEAQDEVQRQVFWLQNPKAVAAPAIYHKPELPTFLSYEKSLHALRRSESKV